MNWYYVADAQQKGPVEDTELERLRQEGVILETTLVWREGMVDWQPYAEATAALPRGAVAAPAAARVACSECGRLFAPEDVVRINLKNVCAECKPLALQKLREGVADAGSEKIRKEHLSHEASIKSVGFLYLLGATLLLVLGFLMPIAAKAAGEQIFLGIFFVILGGAQFWTGLGLRRLRPWSRIVAGILSGIGLLGFPLGTLINAYILYLLFSKKGAMVFSADYQRVIEETPHLKYRTSIIVWIFLGLLLALIGMGLLAFIFRSSR